MEKIRNLRVTRFLLEFLGMNTSHSNNNIGKHYSGKLEKGEEFNPEYIDCSFTNCSLFFKEATIKLINPTVFLGLVISAKKISILKAIVTEYINLYSDYITIDNSNICDSKSIIDGSSIKIINSNVTCNINTSDNGGLYLENSIIDFNQLHNCKTVIYKGTCIILNYMDSDINFIPFDTNAKLAYNNKVNQVSLSKR